MGGSGRERGKEREDVVKGEGENEGAEERKIRKITADVEENSDQGSSERKRSSEPTSCLASIPH